MQDARRISVNPEILLKVSSTGVSVGVKPADKRIPIDVEELLTVSSTGVSVGIKPAER
ncbi:MAG TPA: hypothetical protein GX405_18600 [Rhizobiales bacterium]|nr:hypothetical protein [Hyphomicrobiales bacterium]